MKFSVQIVRNQMAFIAQYRIGEAIDNAECMLFWIQKISTGKISPSFQFIWITSIFMKNHSVSHFFREREFRKTWHELWFLCSKMVMRRVVINSITYMKPYAD